MNFITRLSHIHDCDRWMHLPHTLVFDYGDLEALLTPVCFCVLLLDWVIHNFEVIIGLS